VKFGKAYKNKNKNDPKTFQSKWGFSIYRNKLHHGMKIFWKFREQNK